AFSWFLLVGFRDPASENLEKIGRSTLGVRIKSPHRALFFPSANLHTTTTANKVKDGELVRELNLLVLQTSVSILTLPFSSHEDNACQTCDYSLKTVSQENVLGILHLEIVLCVFHIV